MKNTINISLMLGVALLVMGCDKSANDPETIARDSLNPPSALVTLTGEDSITLKWNTTNAEDDFKGYNVFGKKTTLAGLSGKYVDPSTDADLAVTSMPRCVGNSSLFEAFGFPATDADCPNVDSASLTGGARLAEEDVDFNTIKLSCDGLDSTNVSVPVEGASLATQTCVVKKVGDEDISTSENYTFFVVAVVGDDYDEISWTSNFVEDSPAVNVYSATLTFPALPSDSAGSTSSKYFYIQLPGATFADVTASSATNCTNVICSYSPATNNTDVNPNSPGIYLGRENVSSTYQQRFWLSSSSFENVQIQGREHPGTGNVSGYGDEAVTGSTAYNAKGAKFPVYGDEVFDFMYTASDTTVHYGKIVIGQITNTSSTSWGELKVEVNIIVNPIAQITDSVGHQHYMH